MAKNILIEFFNKCNKKEINYAVRSKSYKHLPNSLNNKDVDLLLEKKDFNEVKAILSKLNFIFYPNTEPHFMYYAYDTKLGLVQIDILLIDKLPATKNYKMFYILKDEFKPIKKSFIKKIITFTKRKFHFFLRGRLICFIGPDGSGKTTTMNSCADALIKFPIKQRRMLFGSLPKSAIGRLIKRIWSIWLVYWYLFTGKIILTDRYIYLTFRKSPKLNMLVRSIAPSPDYVFIMKASYKKLKERRGNDCLTKDTINELYTLFKTIPEGININTENKFKSNLDFIVGKVLRLYN